MPSEILIEQNLVAVQNRSDITHQHDIPNSKLKITLSYQNFLPVNDKRLSKYS
jgi:hypothetical protein